MADVHNKATRSKNMRAIGTRDTAIEKRLAGLLTHIGFEFRTALTERLEEWICGGGETAQIDTQGIRPLKVSPPDTA